MAACIRMSVSRSSRCWTLSTGMVVRRHRRTVMTGASPRSLVLLQQQSCLLASSTRRRDSSLSAAATPVASNETSSQVGESSWSDSLASEAAGRACKDSYEDAIYRVLCEPLMSNGRLLSLMGTLLQAGETPSVGLMESLSQELSESRDIEAVLVMRDLFRRALPDTAEGKPLSVMYLAVVRAHIIRGERVAALAAVDEMEEATGRVADASVFVDMLDMCAAMPAKTSRRELEEIWSQIEARGLTTGHEICQDLFVARMVAFANSSGQEPNRLSQDAWHRDIETRLDDIWENMLQALSDSEVGGGSLEKAVGLVSGRSWLVRARSLALCARDGDPASISVMSRSLESLRAFLQSGERFDDDALASLVSVLRGIARCGQANKVPQLLEEMRETVKLTDEDSEATSATAAGLRVGPRMEILRNASFPERVLRAFRGAWSGRPQEQDQRTACAEQMIEVIQHLAAEARFYETPTLDNAQSLLAARLQALRSVVANLSLEDRAGSVRDAAACAAREAQESYEDATSEVWPGASRAALSLLASLQGESGRAGVDDALVTVKLMHQKGLTLPQKTAAHLYRNVWRSTRDPKTTRRARALLMHHYERKPTPAMANSWAEMMDETVTASEGEQEKQSSKGEHRKNKRRGGGNGAGDAGNMTAIERLSAAPPKTAPPPSLSPQDRYRAIRGANRWLRRGRLFGYVLDVSPTERECFPDPGHGSIGDRRGDMMDGVELLALKGDALGALNALRAMRGEVDWHGGYAADGVAEGDDGTARVMAGKMPVPSRVYTKVVRTIGVRNLYSSKSMAAEELARSPFGALDWLLRDMADQGYLVNTKTLNLGLNAYFRSAGWRVNEDVDEEDRKRCFSEAMDLMAGMCDGWAGLHRSNKPDRRSFTTMIQIAARLGLHSQIIEIMGVMEKQGFKPDVSTFNAIITELLAHDGGFEIAWQTLLEMTNRGLKPNGETLDKMMLYFLNAGELWRSLSFAQHSFNQYGCTPSPGAFTEVLKSAIEAGDDGKHEARRAVVIAKQLWTSPAGGKGKGQDRAQSHPVLTRSVVRLLQHHGVYDD